MPFCCALLFATPTDVAVPGLIFLNLLLPATLTAGVVYTQNAWRAFCIGGLFPSGLLLCITGWFLGLLALEFARSIRFNSGWIELFDKIAAPYRVYTTSRWLMVIAIGLIIVLVRSSANKST